MNYLGIYFTRSKHSKFTKTARHLSMWCQKSVGEESNENIWKRPKNQTSICKNLSISIFMILIRRMQVTCLSQPNQRASMSRSYGRS